MSVACLRTQIGIDFMVGLHTVVGEFSPSGLGVSSADKGLMRSNR